MRLPSALSSALGVLVAALALAGCGSGLPPTPTAATWSTDPSTTSAPSETTETAAATTVPTSTDVAEDVGLDTPHPRPRRTYVAAVPRVPTTTTTTTSPATTTGTPTTTTRTTTTRTTTHTTTSKTTERPSSGGGFRTCAEARAAGVTPLHVGEPGYSSKLDRDGDGVACE